MQLEAVDRSGLLWAIGRALRCSEVRVLRAQFRTEAGRAFATLDIEELDQRRIDDERRLAIQVAVYSALQI